MAFWVELQCDALLHPKCEQDNGTDGELMGHYTLSTLNRLWQKARVMGWRKIDGKQICPRCQNLC